MSLRARYPLLLPLLAACASSHVLVGSPRPPIDPAQVRVYFAPPAGGYEQIAMLQSNSGAFTYGEQNKMNSVIAKPTMSASAATVSRMAATCSNRIRPFGTSSYAPGAAEGSWNRRLSQSDGSRTSRSK